MGTNAVEAKLTGWTAESDCGSMIYPGLAWQWYEYQMQNRTTAILKHVLLKWWKAHENITIKVSISGAISTSR